MEYILLEATDNAQGQLDSSVGPSTLMIVLGTGEGARFPEIIRDSATSAGDENTLNSTGIGASGVEVGDFIENLTDGSHAYVVSIGTNSIETTTLQGGSSNVWGNADEWVVGRFEVTLNSRNVISGAIEAYEIARVSDRSGDTLTVETGDRGMRSTTAQSWDAGDYVNLFVGAEQVEGIYKGLAEMALDINSLQNLKADLSYVDAALASRNWKQHVVAASTANVTLASGVENGDTLDGVTLTTGDRILLKDQSTTSQNGIYIVAASGAPTRATDFDTASEVTSALVAVRGGTVNADSVWICISDNPVVGTDPIEFSRFTLAEYNALREELLFLSGQTLTDSGSANAYVVTCDNLITSLDYGQIVKVKITNENTGDSTLRFKNLLSLDETDSIKWPDGTALQKGDLPAGSIAIFGFDGTNWQLLNGSPRKYRGLLKNLKSTMLTYEYILSRNDCGGSAGTPNWYEYLSEIQLSNDSAEDLIYVSKSMGRDNNSASNLGPTKASGLKYSATCAFRSVQSTYNYGFSGFRSAIDCPGAADTAHHAGFIFEGSNVYASVADGTTQSKVAVTVPSLTAYSTFKVEFDGTDWKFYIDDMDTPVATRTANKPTYSQLVYWFTGIDSNNTTSRDLMIKRKVIFESEYSS
jgi:hypothetical protein